MWPTLWKCEVWNLLFHLLAMFAKFEISVSPGCKVCKDWKLHIFAMFEKFETCVSKLCKDWKLHLFAQGGTRALVCTTVGSGWPWISDRKSHWPWKDGLNSQICIGYNFEAVLTDLTAPTHQWGRYDGQLSDPQTRWPRQSRSSLQEPSPELQWPPLNQKYLNDCILNISWSE